MEKKALYLATNFNDLQKLSAMANLEMTNVKMACTLLDKLFQKHEEAVIDCDEELAYVYALRFLESLSNVRKVFKTDIKYVNAIVGSKKSNIAFERAESLKNVLKERYSLQYSIHNNKDKSKSTGEKKVIESNTDEIKGIISCNEIYKHLKSGHRQLLFVDIRERAEYNQCHINSELIVNIPCGELKQGSSIDDVDSYLKKRGDDKELVIWKHRTTSYTVIIIDWDMKSLVGVNLVKDAIYKWDAEKKIKEPVLLEGGLKSFLLYYPTMVTNSHYNGPIDESKGVIKFPEDIKYPDWNAIEAEKNKIAEEANKKKRADEANKKKLAEEANKKKLAEEANKKKLAEEANKKPFEISEQIRIAEITEQNKLIEMKENKICDEESRTDAKKELCDYSLDDRFKKLRSDKLFENSISDIPSLRIDRSLKPEVHKIKPTEGAIEVTEVSKKNPIVNLIKIDRTLKPDINKEVIHDDIEVVADSPDKSPQIRRLSSNSRTDQDRNHFTARGGAKSIAPPPESEKSKLPPWISLEFDHSTNEHYYLDRKTNMRYTSVPDEYTEKTDDTTVTDSHIDKVETLKDHASHKPRNSTTSSNMKRSISQPNLIEEAIAAVPMTQDVNDINITPKELPRPDRLNKPSYNKTFNEFDANRLNSFNPTYRNVSPGLTGLHNMGNTCYMNSVIQALSNTKFLTNYILTGSYRHDINRKNPLGYQGDLVNEFAFLTTALWKGLYKEISPVDFKKMVDSKNEMFRGGEQHDSQEFLLFILDGLHEDLNIGVRNAKLQLPGDTDQMSDMERSQLSWKAHVAINDSVIVRMFQGQYRSKVTCDHCLKSSVTFDAFMYLSLPLVTSHSRCSLDECIKLFLAEEKMTGGCQWFCPKCKTNRNARKKIDIWKLPPYLLIHLKRFSCSGQYRHKLNTFIDFPMESLSLSAILNHTSSQTQKHQDYHLYAVSNHHGNMESGHYTSYCKNIKEGAWYNYDDDVVTRIKESDVKTPSAYILFYESYNLKKATFNL